MDNTDSIIYTNIVPNLLKYHNIYKFYNSYNMNYKLYFYSPSESTSNNIWNHILNITDIDSIKILINIIKKNIQNTNITLHTKINVMLNKDDKLNIQLGTNTSNIGAYIKKFNNLSMFKRSVYNVNLHKNMQLININNLDVTELPFTEIENIIDNTPRPIDLIFTHNESSCLGLKLSEKMHSELFNGFYYNSRVNILHMNYSHDTLFEYIALKLNIYKNEDNICYTTCEKVFHHGTHMNTLNYDNYINNKNVQYGIINIKTYDINIQIVLDLLKYIEEQPFEIIYKNFDNSNISSIFNNCENLVLAFLKPESFQDKGEE